MSFTVKSSNGSETKPFNNYEDAFNHAKAWIGQFSIFNELQIFEDGIFLQDVHVWDKLPLIGTEIKD